jgi:hypothetical protein
MRFLQLETKGKGSGWKGQLTCNKVRLREELLRASSETSSISILLAFGVECVREGFDVDAFRWEVPELDPFWCSLSLISSSL